MPRKGRRSCALQVSRGHLVSPEQLTPEVNQDRTAGSATYNRAFKDGDWQTTLAWGRDENNPGRTTDAFLLESALSKGRHTVLGRAENVDKDELFSDQPASPLYDRSFNVSKFSAGYYYTMPIQHHLALDLGGLVSKYALPSALDTTYGSDPTSFMLFARIKIAGWTPMTKTSLLLAAVVLPPATALAHAHVTRSDPAANGVVHASPKAVRISFSEPVMMAFTGAEVKDAAGHVARAGKPALENGGKTLVVPLANSLKPGTYVVACHAVSGDTHRVAGRFGFSVRP